MESDLRRKIYSQVSQHVDIGDYDNFSKAMDDPARRKNFHTAVSDYVDMGDFDKFDTAIKNDPQVKFWNNFNKSVMGTDLQESGNTPEGLKSWADYGSKVEDEKKAAADKQTPWMDALTAKSNRKQFAKGYEQMDKPGLGNKVAGGLNEIMSAVNLVGYPFNLADQTIRKFAGGENVANALGYPFKVVGETIENTPGAITEALDETGIKSKLRDLFPNFRIDPKTAAAITDPIKQATALGGQVILGAGMEGLNKGIKEKAGIPDNLKAMMNESSAAGQRLSDPTRNDFGNWNAPDNPPTPKPAAVPLGEARQLKQPSDFHVNPDGTVSRGIDELKDLKSEREGLVNELHILRSKLNLSENPATQKKLQGFIDDRMDRINTIDKTISPGKKTSPITSLDNSVAKPVTDHLTGEDIQNLPSAIADKMKGTADNLQSELKNASVDRSGSYGTYENNGEGYTTTRSQKGFTVNYFPKWFSDLGRGKEDVIAALQKIKEDAGKDRGKLVEDLKNEIIERLKGNHEDVLRMNVGGVDHTENMGAIPGDPEISDFINSIDKNLTLQQLHDEYQAFEDASKFDPEMFSKEEPGTPEKVQNSVGSEGKNAPGRAQIKEPVYSSTEGEISSPGLNADKPTISEEVTEKVPKRVKPKNKIFTEEAYNQAKQNMLDRANRLSANIDPEQLKDLITVGGYHFESGIRQFSGWSKEMIKEFGDKVKPHLTKIWNEVLRNKDPEMVKMFNKSVEDGISDQWGKFEVPKKRFVETMNNMSMTEEKQDLHKIQRARTIGGFLSKFVPRGQDDFESFKKSALSQIPELKEPVARLDKAIKDSFNSGKKADIGDIIKPVGDNLYKKVLNQYAKGGTLNSADLGEYANEKLPTTELFKRIKDLGLTEDVKDIQKKINVFEDPNVQNVAEDYERIARIALKEAEGSAAVKEPEATSYKATFKVKPPKKLYRGVMNSGIGAGTSSLGKGLYSSTDKAWLKTWPFDKIIELDPNVAFPKNPLVLNAFGNAPGALYDWLRKQSGEKSMTEFNKKYDISEFVKSKGYDGVIAGGEIVKYSDEPITDLFGKETKEPAAKSTKKAAAAEDDMFSPEMKKTQLPETPVDKGKAAKADETTPLFKKETPKDKNQGSLELQSTVMPGLKQFAEEDLTPAVEKALGGIKAMAEDAMKKFAPESRGAFAKRTVSLTRKQTAILAHKDELLNKNFNDYRKFFNRQDPEINQQRILDAEGGKYSGTKPEQDAMRIMQEHLNKTYKYIVDTYKDGAGSFIENYFPHYWADPEKAAKVFGEVYTKRSLSGPRSFEKQRTLPTIQKGLDLGLKLATDNPVDLFLLKMHEMNKYIMGKDLWQDFKDNKLLKFQRVGEKILDGYAKINDRMGTVFGNPNIPVTEYFDELKRDKLEAMISALGGEHKRSMKLSGGNLGSFGAPNQIRTRFATPLGTLTHELGHYIDETYGLADQFVKNKKFSKELRDLADLRYEGHDPAKVENSYKSYVRKAPEKMANMIDAYVNAPNKFKNVAPNTYAALKSFIDDHSELHGLNEIEDSLVRTGSTMTVNAGGQLIHGYWTMPEQGAHIVNNYIGPGLEGSSFYNMFRKSANTLNSVQLGVSAYHAMFTSWDASTSKLALGMQKLSQGRLIEGAMDLAESPIAPLTNLMQGYRLRQSYYGKNPALWSYVKDLESAGGRVTMDKFFTNNAVEGWFKAWRTGNWVGGAIRTPGALIETLAKPLMQHFVPMQKLGVFMDFAKNIHDEATVKGWDAEEVQYRMQKAWDSVDNRMGQLVYDNLFWNRALKDLGMASVRSLGWNIGDIRELGGAPVDLIKQIKSAATGKGFELTNKMAYAMALPVVTGISGAMLQYLYTGSGPTELKDYFFPKTGKKTPDGTDERLILPTYMRDVWAYGTQPLTTIGHKLQPLLSGLIDMLKNEDYYGYEINDKNFEDSTKKLFEKGDASDLGEGLMNEIKYIGKQFVPFSVQGAMQRKRSGADEAGQAAAFIGLNPAPKYITNTSAQNEIEDTYKQRFSGGVKPKAQEDVDQAKRDIRDALKLKDKGKAQQLINEAVDKGYFEENSQTVKNMMKASNQSFDRFAFGRLPSYDQSAMLEKWNDEDINRYLPYASKDVFKENPELIEKAKSLRDDLLKQIDDLQHSDNPDPEKITPLQKEVAALSKHVGKGTGVDISKDIKGQTVITRRRFGTPDSTGVTTQ